MDRKWNVINELQHLTPCEIEAEYQFRVASGKKCAVACLNLSGDLNIGMMIRTSALFAVEKFIILGRKVYDRRSSVGTQHHIPTERIYTMLGPANEYLDLPFVKQHLEKLSNDHTLVFIEQTPSSIPLQQLPSFEKPPLFIFGSESEGIPKELIGMGMSVEIPQRGVGRSLNVAVACGMVLYEYYREN